MKNIFLYFLFLTNHFNVRISRNDTFTSAITLFQKDLTVDKIYDDNHRLPAVHPYDINLGVITTSSVYCGHKQNKNKQTNITLQNKKANEKKKQKTKTNTNNKTTDRQRFNKKNILIRFEPWTSRCRVLGLPPRLQS